MIDFWRFVPGYMIQNESRDDCWDKILNEALDRFPVEANGGFYCQVGPYEVWVGNWPYAYGTCRGSGLPTVATRKRLRRLICEAECAKLQALMDPA